jgi:hypothetical protein
MSKTVSRKQLILDTQRKLTIICEMERRLKEGDALLKAKKANLLELRKAARVSPTPESRIELGDQRAATSPEVKLEAAMPKPAQILNWRMRPDHVFLRNSQHWRDRAGRTLAKAEQARESEDRHRLLRVAQEYERLAQWAEICATPKQEPVLPIRRPAEPAADSRRA